MTGDKSEQENGNFRGSRIWSTKMNLFERNRVIYASIHLNRLANISLLNVLEEDPSEKCLLIISDVLDVYCNAMPTYVW